MDEVSKINILVAQLVFLELNNTFFSYNLGQYKRLV